MQYIIKGILLTGSIVLSACASIPQQPKTFDQLGEYQEIALNQSTYRISFRADKDISQGQAEEIALLKSAQVTRQKGFDFFKVIEDPSNPRSLKKIRQNVVYTNRAYYPYYGRYGRFYRPYWNDPFYDYPYVVNIDPIEVSYTIQFFKTEHAPADSFEASRILQSIGSKYGLGPDGNLLMPLPQPATKTN